MAFLALKNMFPSIEDNVIYMVYQNCDKNVDEAINCLLCVPSNDNDIPPAPPLPKQVDTSVWLLCSRSIPSDPIQMNDNEMIMFTNKITSFYVYNSINDKFCKLTQSLNISREKLKTVSIDNLKSILYIYTKSGKIISYNIITKKWNILSSFDDKQNQNEACSVMIDSNYHIFTRYKHFMWNINQKKLYKLSGCDELTNDALQNGVSFYLKTNKKCLIIDGNDASVIYQCSITDYQWTKNKINLPNKLNSFGCILTMNERYILMFGGKLGNNYTNSINDIFIIDTDNFNVKKSVMKCPKNGEYFACLMGNEVDLLCDGYIQYCWRLSIFNNMRYPSIDVLRIIKAYYGIGSVHLFCRTSGHHWKLRLTQILP